MKWGKHWLVAVSFALACAAPALATPLASYLDPNVLSGTDIVNGQVEGFYRAGVSLANTGNYAWWYGCSPTSAGMVMGYYDRNGYGGLGYSNLVPGGVAEANTFGNPGALVNGIIASAGHVTDFYHTPPGYNGSGDDTGPTHNSDCLADFMGTSQDSVPNNNGWTTWWYWVTGAPYTRADALANGKAGKDGMYGIGSFVGYEGYSYSQLFTQHIYVDPNNYPLGFTFNDYKAEIDAGRPVVIHLEGHDVFGYGYTSPNTVILYDTWVDQDGGGPYQNGMNPGTMTWGGSYAGMYEWGVSCLTLSGGDPPVIPEPMTLSLLAFGLVGLAARRRGMKRAA